MKPDTILTYTGKLVQPLSLDPDDIDLRDIAHALAYKCRFTGHTVRFYSIAEHCLHVSRLLPPPLHCLGLLHDAAEAYLPDIATPIKHLFPNLIRSEQGIMNKVIKKYRLAGFGADELRTENAEQLGQIDSRMCHMEGRQLLLYNPCVTWWTIPREAFCDFPLPCYPPEVAERKFLKRIKELGIIGVM
jgi:hypothetical protein